MRAKLNKAAFDHAKELIRDGKYDDSDGSWQEKQPSRDAENAFIKKHGTAAYGKWYLGMDAGEDKDNKGRYKFPYGDFNKVQRDGLIAAKQRAAQNDYGDIEKAANELLEALEQAVNKSKPAGK